MAESYTTALRDKRELEMKLRNFSRDGRRNINKIKQEKFTLVHGLHDVRSKTKNLHDTIAFIRKSLQDQKSLTEEELLKLAARRRAMTQKDAEREKQLLVKLELADVKARNIGFSGADDSDDDAVDAVRTAVAGQQLRPAEADRRSKLPDRESEETRAAIGDSVRSVELPDNLPDLIRFYVKYPPVHRVAIKRPKKTEFARSRLAKFKEDQENALSNGTKTRLRRVDFHCKAIENVYLDEEPVEEWSRKLSKATGAKAQ